MTDFPTLLYTSTSEIPTLSYTLTQAEPPRIGHHGEYCLKFIAFSMLCLFKGDVFAELNFADFDLLLLLHKLLFSFVYSLVGVIFH